MPTSGQQRARTLLPEELPNVLPRVYPGSVPVEEAGEPVAVPSDALVIRFRPIAPDAVLRRAVNEFKRTGRHGASVFATTGRAGESDSAMRRRLLAVAELAGMSPENHPKYYVCAHARELIRRGFVFYKDGDDDERDEHYSVDLGPAATLDDAERFLEAFGPAEERSQL